MRSRRVNKILVIGALTLCVLLPSLFALALDGYGTYASAMGGAGLALPLAPDSFFANPALLGSERTKTRSLIATTGFGDELASYGKHFRFEYPQADGSITFLAKRLALTIQSRTIFENYLDFGSYSTYDGLKLTLFELDWAWGLGPLSLGLRAQAVATSARGDIQLNADQILLDYLVQSAIARYDNVEERATINFGFGLLLDYDWIAIGVVVDQFAYSRGEESLALDSDSLIKSLGWGLSLSSPTYTADNDLHLFKVQGALDLVNLGSDENREIRVGLSAKLQLLPDWSVSFLTGYREVKTQAGDLIKISPSNGRHSIGLGGELGNAELLLLYEYPTAWYTQSPTAEASTLSFSLSIQL